MKNGNNLPQQPYGGKTYAYIAVGCIIAAFATFGLIFTVIGIYALIASVLLSLAALAGTNIQKKKNAFKSLTVIKIFAYIALAASAGTFAGGIIWSAIS